MPRSFRWTSPRAAPIARIRGQYRSLSAKAARLFAPERGRWPEVQSPAERLGRLSAFLGTTSSMIAVINNVVAGAGVALWVQALGSSRSLAVGVGAGVALALTTAFLVYQRWRFVPFDDAGSIMDER